MTMYGPEARIAPLAAKVGAHMFQWTSRLKPKISVKTTALFNKSRVSKTWWKP